MKTVEEWFNCLRPDLRDKAIKNCIKQFGKERLGNRYFTFSSALYNAFYWDNSPERGKFWSDIFYKAVYIELGRKPDIKPKKYKKGDIVKFKGKKLKSLKSK